MPTVQVVAGNNGAGATTLVITIAASGTGSSLILRAGPRSLRVITGVTDNKSNSWTIPALSNPDFQLQAVPMGAYCLAPLAGTTTITITLDSSGVCGAAVEEATGVGAYIGGILGNNGGVNATSWTSHGVVSSGSCRGFGWSSTGVTGITYAGTGGWTQCTGTGITANQGNVNATDGDQVVFLDQDFASAGTRDANGTCTSSLQFSAIMLFEQAASDVLMGQACY